MRSPEQQLADLIYTALMAALLSDVPEPEDTEKEFTKQRNRANYIAAAFISDVSPQ